MAQSKSEESKARQNRFLKRNFYIGFVLVVALAIAATIYLISDEPPEVDAARLDLDPVIGAEDAPVTVYEFGTYGCYICRATHQSGFNAQLEQMIEDDYAGQVKFVFVNFPIRSPHDPLSAEAAQCALDQGQEEFWNFHNSIYAKSNSEYADMTARDDYVAFAREIGIDDNALEECLSNETHARTVRHHEQRARDRLVRGTPTFFVNDQQVQPEIDAVRELIDEALN